MAYRIGYVYRITKNDDNNVNYIGSTFQTLQQRWNVHKTGKCSIGKYLDKYGCENFKIVLIKEYLVCAENNKDFRHLRSYEQLWINKFRFKKCCINKYDSFCLLKKEKYREYYNKYRQEHKEQKKEYYNKYRQEHKEQAKEYQKEYKQDHKEHITEQQKKYYQENKEKIKEQVKEYRQDHKEQIKEYQKEYRLENKEQIKEYRQYNREKMLEQQKQYRLEHREQLKAKQSEKITCECGCIMRRDKIARHRRSTKHFNLMNSN